MFNPHSLGEDLSETIRQFKAIAPQIERQLQRFTKKNYKLEKMVVTTGPESARFKFSIKKAKGDIIGKTFFVTVTYNKGSDSYSAVSGFMNGQGQVLKQHAVDDLYTDNLVDVFWWASKGEPVEESYLPKDTPESRQLERQLKALNENRPPLRIKYW